MKWQTAIRLLWFRTNQQLDRGGQARLVCPGFCAHAAGRNSKLSHPGGQKHSGCKASPPPPHTHMPCLPADCGYCRSVSSPPAMGQWLAGKWLLCLQHGRQIQACTVLDSKLYLSCIHFGACVLPIKGNRRTFLLCFSSAQQPLANTGREKQLRGNWRKKHDGNEAMRDAW